MMTDRACAEMRLLIQADIDGELGPSEAARVEAHLERCNDCDTIRAEFRALSERLRAELPYHAASSDLRASLRKRLALVATRPKPMAVASVTQPLPWWKRLWPSRLRAGTTSFCAGFAVAACLMLLVALPQGSDLPDTVVAGHIRALQPGHLMDIASTDQHTVKPWFDGRLDYAPPVKDLKAVGFPLTGGRLDYLTGRPVAVLIYQRRQHILDVFVWPDGSDPDREFTQGARNGYNFVHWSKDGMTFWAVSDLSTEELTGFASLWRDG